ncbi:MAG TPA: carboxypeptidase-like regulatory domain-containing protein, partial [Bryobacteraceae bacterium]|nr:carboxypeptidase-like regulatory domain-containing protein [Bryobacteraceae bacterium]
MLTLTGAGALFAQSGYVKSANQPIPGATVTVTTGGVKLTTTTDPAGHYALSVPPAGECTIGVQMFGFQPATKKSTCAQDEKIDFTLQLQESPMAARLGRANGAGAANQFETQ